MPGPLRTGCQLPGLQPMPLSKPVACDSCGHLPHNFHGEIFRISTFFFRAGLRCRRTSVRRSEVVSEPRTTVANERARDPRDPPSRLTPVRRDKTAREKTRASAAKRATRTERAGEAARERACKEVRGAKPLGVKN